MSASLDQSIQNLCKLSAELNDYVDRVNVLIREYEQALRDSGVGVAVWLEDPIRVPDGSSCYLGWCRDPDGIWCFHVAENLEGGPFYELLEGNRWVRVSAFSKLPAIVELLTDRVSKELEILKPLKQNLPEAPPEDDDIPF